MRHDIYDYEVSLFSSLLSKKKEVEELFLLTGSLVGGHKHQNQPHIITQHLSNIGVVPDGGGAGSAVEYPNENEKRAMRQQYAQHTTPKFLLDLFIPTPNLHLNPNISVSGTILSYK
jgi:hypothetical protein